MTENAVDRDEFPFALIGLYMKSKVSARLTESVAPEIIENIFAPRLSGFRDVFLQLGEINRAHVVMLHECQLLSDERAGALARGIIEIEESGPDVVELDPNREDPYFNYEAHLMAKVGPDIGGRLHMGRSRNDLGATLDRLRARETLLDMISGLLSVRQTVLNQATKYSDSVMPGYTHLQPAQPITYGFYLSAIDQALARDTQRLFDALRDLNACPLGAAAFAGTPFAINRARTAELLGFDDFVGNTLDAVASRDFMLDTLSAMSMLAVLWSRIAQDFHVWSTHEFGLIEFPDSVASTSSIMPQKKNHVVLEYLKGRSGHVIAAYVGAATGMKGTNFSHSGESSRVAVAGVWDAARDVQRCLVLLELVIRSAAPVIPRGFKLAAEDFSTATALADMMVRDHDLSFRTAHHIVGAVVRKAIEADMPADRITIDMVEQSAIDHLGAPLGISADILRACLDPRSNIQARNSPGGPSPAVLRTAINEASTALELAQEHVRKWRDRVEGARGALQDATVALAKL